MSAIANKPQQIAELVETKDLPVEAEEDIFGAIVEFEKENFAIGVLSGEAEALERSKTKSREEGEAYGESIGNHMGYYSTSLDILAANMPE